MRYSKVMSDPNRYARDHFRLQKPNTGRRLAISDIHGCAITFERLLEEVGFSKRDQLFLLGDYIHKGPDSKGVVDRILALIEEGYQIYPLRGNHEQMLLDHHYLGQPSQYQYIILGLSSRRKLLDYQKRLLPHYQPFFVYLPYYYELEHCILVHAGIDCFSPEPFKDFRAMIWQREFSIIPEVVNHKKIIYGHVPQVLADIERSVADEANLKICIDGGAVYRRKVGLGHLVCLDLDTFGLTVVQNAEK